MNKLKLYGVRIQDNEERLPTTYTSDKFLARRLRDALTAETGVPHVVCYGPDHKKFKQKEPA